MIQVTSIKSLKIYDDKRKFKYSNKHLKFKLTFKKEF